MYVCACVCICVCMFAHVCMYLPVCVCSYLIIFWMMLSTHKGSFIPRFLNFCFDLAFYQIDKKLTVFNKYNIL